MKERVGWLAREQKKGLAVFSVIAPAEDPSGRNEAAKLKYVHGDAVYGYDRLHE
ncbi:hypothetical protein [Paenibacillus sp. EPM92]|uniref:hypothetical protein n=1 Tax=Paenibacillus sp. EPM92 TaxID=1561195 RepID=UPI0019169E8C|nr:hypothetical protein [Paenibacillus sp. EPM92]